MSHTYLVELYELLDDRLQEAQEHKDMAKERSEMLFQKGRIETLGECKQFLIEQYNPKLPRRLQAKYLA